MVSKPIPPQITGLARLTPDQLGNWSLINKSIRPPQSATGLWLVKTDYKMDTNAFPDNGAYSYVYGSPTHVRLMTRIDGPAAALDYVLQISTESTTYNLMAPYVGWDKPAGLITQETFKNLSANAVPEDPAHTKYDKVNVGGPGTPAVKLSPNSKYVYINRVFPFFTLLGKKGTIFYVRVVPVFANKTQVTPAAPPSNWLPFYITVTKNEQDDIKDKELAAASKQKAEQEAAIAKAKEEEKKKAVAEEQKNTDQALSNAYEVRLLSYIPPKFYDDQDASQYFLANRNVTVTYNGGESVTTLIPGDTYQLGQVKNMINSNKTWSQEMWELASATLNQASQGYQAAKNACVDTVASGINVTGLKCGGGCKDAMMIGLNAALASCGIPPSIPNVDQLYGNGLEYLTSTVADMALEQMSGVAIGDLGVDADTTKALAKKARGPVNDGLKKMLYSISHPAPFDGGVPETWGVPSPFFRHRPAMLYLEIRLKPGAAPVTNQVWQGLTTIVDGDFASILAPIALPRTIEDRVRIPIALSALQDPASWVKYEKFPDQNFPVGQPYYGSRGLTKFRFITYHKISGGGPSVVKEWPAIQIDTGYINAIPLPDHGLTKKKLDDALNSDQIKYGPSNYYGKLKYRPF